MTGNRQGVAEAAQALAEFAREAAYVAIGMGVIEFQKAQVRRRELTCARRLIAKTAEEIDYAVTQVFRAVDSTFEPVVEMLPAEAQAMVREARRTRDELRARVLG